MKAHIGVDAESGLVHSLVGTPPNVAGIAQVNQLKHGAKLTYAAMRITALWRSVLSIRTTRWYGRLPRVPAAIERTEKEFDRAYATLDRIR